jgi:hypothetical protein
MGPLTLTKTVNLVVCEDLVLDVRYPGTDHQYSMDFHPFHIPCNLTMSVRTCRHKANSVQAFSMGRVQVSRLPHRNTHSHLIFSKRYHGYTFNALGRLD